MRNDLRNSSQSRVALPGGQSHRLAMDILRQEVRYAVRSIRRTPLASSVVIATLAVGIALVTTFFSLVNTAFFHPLPYPNANRTIALSYYGVRQLPIEELRKMTRTLSRVGTTIPGRVTVTGGGNAISVRAAEVDSSIFPILGVSPVLGRLPNAREIAARERVVVINERLWRKRFGGVSDVVGKTLIMDDVPRTIVAVMPGWVDFPTHIEAWYPMEAQVKPEDQSLHPVGLLAPNATRDDVQRELLLLGARLNQIDSSTYHVGRTGGMYALRDMVDRGRDKGPITMMVLLTIGGAVCVLLVACTNVASVMLARAARRRGEMAIRASLGASQWQMVRQQVLESVVLATAAGAAGTLLSLWGIRLVIGLLPGEVAQNFLPGWADFGLDANVLAFSAAVSLLTVLVFGLWPAREATRFDLTRALRGADPAIAGEDPTKRVHLPVVLELTLSLPLFVAAVLMLRSFGAIANVDRGYATTDRSRIYLGSILRDSNMADYTRTLRQVQERLAQSKAVGEVAAESHVVRFASDTSGMNGVTVVSTRRALAFYREISGTPTLVSDNFFGVMGMRIVRGRTFGPSDAEATPLAVIVSQRFATEAWGQADPIGQQLVVTKAGSRATVVGVASDRFRSRNEISGGKASELYFSVRQGQAWCCLASLVVHSQLTAPALTAATNQALRDIGQERPLTVEPFSFDIERQQLMPKMFSSILGTFAAAGLILAVMGIYGVVAFSVEQRTREIGVRIALGATPVDVIRHVMRGGVQLVGIAIVMGLLASAAIGRVLTAFVSGSTLSHVVTAILVAMGFATIAVFACWFPARHAAALDPLKALRSD